MNSVKVRPEQFNKAVLNALAEYGDDVTRMLETEVKTTARETVSMIKSQSPSKTGRYLRGWSHKAAKAGAYKLSETVYNRTDYQLTHLLEKPHSTWNGGHYPKHKDHTGILARIEEEQTNKFMSEVLSKL